MDQDFEIIFNLSGDDSEHVLNITKDIECPVYLDRVEECHGYHSMYEPDEQVFEENVQLFIENQTNDDLIGLINENYDYFVDEAQVVTNVISIKPV